MEKIEEILSRGVTDVIVKSNLQKALKEKTKLRIKYGIDPTGARVHIGHAVPIWKLRDFQDLGHQIVLILGDFTAQIGDTSDKTAERKPLTFEEVQTNMRTYLDQIGKILDLKKTEIRYNSEWHGKASKQDLLSEAMNFTVNQMIQRDNFKQRYEADKPIGLHEFLYPLLQGYDSVAVKADVEIGGNDQYFNLLAGRTLQKRFGQKEQDIMTFALLEGSDGRKMSKSYGNCIFIDDEPNEIFGKAMAVDDSLIIQYMILATDCDISEIEKNQKDLERGGNPRDAKVKLAWNLVKRYYGEKEADKAQENFEKTFVKKETPDAVDEVAVIDKNWPVADLLHFTKMVSSKSEARRLIDQGGVKVDGAVIGDREATIRPQDDMIIQVGKRKFIKIILDK
ncbi:MAG: tyrosine--tRNA ligase [Patescibacteria group bacterium]|nr:tyrosine--tRNA ligase [Patescibacteria group bacterium]